MDHVSHINRLATFPAVIEAVVEGVNIEEWRWHPEPDQWSMLEILGHLASEEVNDFRQRLRLTLEDPSEPWPAIDPEGEVKSSHFNRRDPAEVVATFVAERNETVNWLRNLETYDWTKTHEHEQLGPIRAGDLLSSWVAHDALHLRQLSRRRYQCVGRNAGKYATWYAGSWG